MPSLDSIESETYNRLHISRNSDGSLTRNYPVPFTPPNGDQPWPVLSKDVPLNAGLNTSIRIFVPNLLPVKKKLPVVVYFHPGGFILCTPAIAPISNFTARMAAVLPAVVLSVDHRLAPEHRLPAAYDDALDALLWVKNQAQLSRLSDEAAEPWMNSYADFSRVFLMGSSSGGNIAYHLSLRALTLDLVPLELAGIIMDQPFFGGEERTESETRLADDKFLPRSVTDLMWELSLPVGSDRDHEYSNPKNLKGKGKGLPKCFLRGYVGDLLIDRMRTVATMLKKEGVSVVSLLNEEGYHGVELFDSSKADAMLADLRDFLYIDA